MKLSSIKKKYPKAFAEWYFSDVILDIDIRNFYSSIVDHFDKLGINLGIDVGELVQFEVIGVDIYSKDENKIWWLEDRKYFENRKKAETAGLSKLFEIRETQLKKVVSK